MNQPSSFLGYAGVGSRISISQFPQKILVKEALGSRLWVVLGLFALGPLTLLRICLQRARWFDHFSFLAITISVLSWAATFFFFRSVVRFIRDPRIEIDKLTGSFYFLGDGAALLESPLSKEHILSAEIIEFATPVKISTDYVNIQNFTLRIHKRNGSFIDACTSDQRGPLQKLIELSVF